MSIHLSRKTLINAIHALLIQFEAHIDSIIKRYKVMSTTILAATVAAIGFSFSGEFKDIQINKLIMAAIACIFGVIGLSSVWYLDIQVFHKFWGSFFVEEVKMEEEHAFLVDIGDIAVSLDNIKARLIGDGNWYIFLNTILIAIAAIIFSFIFENNFVKAVIFVTAGLLAFYISKCMLRAGKRLLGAVEKLLSQANRK